MAEKNSSGSRPGRYVSVLRNEVFGPGGSVLVADDGNVREVSVLLAIVQPVSNHEFVFDGESDVFHFDIDLPAGRLAQKTRRAQAPRRARAQDVLQVGQRQSRIDDVFDNQHVAPLERAVEILEDLHLPG